MTTAPIEYLICRNVHCCLHALFMVGDPAVAATLRPGDKCPICGLETIASALVNAAVSVLKQAGATQTATVVPGLPYGGMVLQRGDMDSSRTWGGVVVSEPRHATAQYVLELQRDLLRLAYYGPARGTETAGVFGLQLMACVLNYKKHLVEQYGIPGDTNFDAVQAGAAGANAPIYYPSSGISSPAEALALVKGWAKHLGTSSANVPLLQSITSWAKGWQALNSNGAPAPGELDALRKQARDDAQLCSQLTGRMPGANSAAIAFSAQMSRLEFPHHRGTLTDAQVLQAEAHLDALVNTLEAVGAPILDLLSRVRVLDARLPGTVALRDPGDQEVTLVPISINGGTLEERYQRLADANRRQSSIRNHQQMALQFARGKLGTFLARIDAMGKQWSDTDKKGELLRQTLDLMLRQVRDSTSGAELLNQSSSARANVTEQLRNARSYSREWLRSATAAPAGSAGAFEQLERVFSEFESTWVPLNVALPDPSWSDFKTRIQDLRVVFARYESAVSNPNADKWGEAYLKALRDFGRVDHATARHIRCMVTLGELGGRKVFLTPRDGEYLLLSDTVDNVLPRVMDNALQGMRRAAGDGPLPIIRFIYHHESGANHVRGFAGSNYVTLGIDWPNGKTSNAFFDEAETPAKVLSTSRGWGATQFTLFHTGRHGLLKDETGASVKFTIVDGIPFSTASSTKRPLPLCIQSAEENLVEGTKLFLDGFRPPPHRECSYQQGGAPSSGHSYACAACAKRLRTGPYRVIGGGVHTFDDAQGDFERIPKLGGPTYKLRSLARLRELLDSGYFALPDGRTSAQVTDADLIEFPCSWLSCVARYAGTTRRGFDYMLEAIETLSRT